MWNYTTLLSWKAQKPRRTKDCKKQPVLLALLVDHMTSDHLKRRETKDSPRRLCGISLCRLQQFGVQADHQRAEAASTHKVAAQHVDSARLTPGPLFAGPVEE